MAEEEPLPDWVGVGAKFRYIKRVYHVRGIVDGNAVLAEWWRSKQYWKYTVEPPCHFTIAKDSIKVLKKADPIEGKE